MRVTLTHCAVSGLLAVLCAGAGGCADASGPYPSLALRPFETGVPQSAPDPSPTPIRPATAPALLAELRGTASASHAAFLTREAEAERIVRAARGLSFESEPRAAALVALAELDTQRAATASALARLDRLAADAASALAADPGLTTLQTEVAALLAREDAGLARLWESMGS
jgi:hypothetical protein